MHRRHPYETTASAHVDDEEKVDKRSAADLFCRKCCGTLPLIGIWIFEALNYATHVVLRPTAWNGWSVCIGYALWAMQLICLWRVQVTNPGMVSAAWTRAALDGEHHARVCERSGELLPERAMFVRRAGGVVLGLDHFCGWLGTPVGLYNRKLFILFVSYSFLFCVMGFFHSLYALLCSLPDSLLPPPPTPQTCAHLSVPDALRHALSQYRVTSIVWESGAACHQALGALIHVLDHAADAGQLVYALCLTATVPANLLACGFLGHLALGQLIATLKNRTTLSPGDAKYDVGMSRNVRMVFGEETLLWALPTRPHILASDGYSWPLNPNHRTGGGGRGDHRASGARGGMASPRVLPPDAPEARTRRPVERL